MMTFVFLISASARNPVPLSPERRDIPGPGFQRDSASWAPLVTEPGWDFFLIMQKDG